MRSLITALGLFTVFPMPVRDLDRDVAGRAILALPAVGVILGIVAGGLGALVGWLANPLLGAVVVVASFAACNGALHLDGLADTVDGLGSRRSRAEALAIMRNSDIGPMGVVALVMALALEVAALSQWSGWMLFAVAVAAGLMSRTVMVLASGTWLPSARKSGFGAWFAATTRPGVALLVGLLSLGLSAAIGFASAWQFSGAAPWRGAGFGLAGLAALVVAHCGARTFVRRLGGITGDTFGALSEASTVVFLLVAACAV